MKWTEEQQKVIDTRGKNILVSAAAGSGKTAVLVARILSVITDEKRPVDIDRLLVLTFTNAAAAEMRERVRDALELRAEAEPDNVHLQRQLVLVHNAKITTIHSFCLNVLRSYFQTLQIDPAFRVADEGEVLLLEQETVRETVEAAYAQREPQFFDFLESAATGKNDKIIEEMILQLYHFALGQPWPAKWLEECRLLYEQGWSETKRPQWLSYIEEDTKELLRDALAQTQKALAICMEPDGPYMYEKALSSDAEMLGALLDCDSYEAYAAAFLNMRTFARLSPKKDESVLEEKKSRVQAIRSGVKDTVTAIRQRYYYDRVEVLREEFEKCAPAVRVLTRLVEDFMERITQKKTQKNVLDFSDLEHLALEVLLKDAVPTTAALEYAETFEEIMTDEYQDSNLVQELILNSVSGRGKGEPNRFMVGDVKQSIYRFRLARPELFLDKYKTYQREGETSCRIDLHKNFRSRAQVLEGVNDVFHCIMTEKLGGIVYDEDAALYPGAVFEPEGQAKQSSYLSELHLLETDAQEKQRQEAELVGARIRNLVGSFPVWDKELEGYRPARYGDIVILLRTVSGWAETFGEVLGDMGIPCFTGSQKGYFSAAEVRVVLAYLQILDNPVQDIPLAAVLRSAIGGFDDEELAVIRTSSGQKYFYDCVQEYRAGGEDEHLRTKLEAFFGVFERLRAKCSHTPMHLLLWEILDVTGYGAYAASLPGGAQRSANLDMLAEKAIAYEATSYRGLYHFVRYIENLKKYEVDYGEASLASEAEQTVRIMSIHKSKGLEFPIVFVSGLGKQFNESDIRSKMVMHPQIGIGCDYVDTVRRTRQANLLKKVIQQRTAAENLGEELRVLYVAMTRAKEKLILTGSVPDISKQTEKWERIGEEGKELPYAYLQSASTYLDWLVPSVSKSTLFELLMRPAENVEQEEALAKSRDEITLSALLNYDASACYDEGARDYLRHVFSLTYPHEADRKITGKLSVSELKKVSHLSEEDEAGELYQTETVVPLFPQFRSGQAPVSGAARGTAYHTFMENLDFTKKEELEIQLEELISCGKMTREEGRWIALSDIRRFLASDAARRMEQAQRRGMLFRERPFVLGIPADEIRADWNHEETVLVQGIIDAYFQEDQTVSIVDYKTDRVSNGQELIGRYRAQLDYYAQAIERLTGHRVLDRIIYSFYLGKDFYIV